MFKFLVLATVVEAYVEIENRQFIGCRLVNELRSQGFPEHQIRDWACLVENGKPQGRTDYIVENSNGSKDYGMFLINNAYWCNEGPIPGKDCHVTCEEVRTADVTKASECAKKIYKRHGFTVWKGWREKCQVKNPKLYEDISKCPLQVKNSSFRVQHFKILFLLLLAKSVV